jgi:hypothetical protein
VLAWTFVTQIYAVTSYSLLRVMNLYITWDWLKILNVEHLWVQCNLCESAVWTWLLKLLIFSFLNRLLSEYDATMNTFPREIQNNMLVVIYVAIWHKNWRSSQILMSQAPYLMGFLSIKCYYVHLKKCVIVYLTQSQWYCMYIEKAERICIKFYFISKYININ